MIISASYKTDIPTFYGEWFMNRLRAGYCKMVNPWNRKQVIRVSLQPADVDGIVFWTKNVGPFMHHLTEVRERGHPFILQHTINAYPRALEFSVVDASRSVEHFRKAADQFGPKVCIWRYDTIVMTSETPANFHSNNFARLCRDLEGATDEVVVSFAQLYRKTLRNMDWAANSFGFTWHDPQSEEKRDLLEDLVPVARSHGMRLTICSQPDFVVAGTHEARCIDAERLEEISGKRIRAELRGARKECGCFASRDIGEYDTCPHGCVYCYAVQNRNLAQRRFREHDPESEFLFPVGNVAEDAAPGDRQRTLFDDAEDDNS